MGAERELTDPSSVMKAVAEFDELGREAFLDKYGFGPAYKYLLVVDGKEYDAKAVIGVARGFQYPERGPLASQQILEQRPSSQTAAGWNGLHRQRKAGRNPRRPASCVDTIAHPSCA